MKVSINCEIAEGGRGKVLEYFAGLLADALRDSRVGNDPVGSATSDRAYSKLSSLYEKRGD